MIGINVPVLGADGRRLLRRPFTRLFGDKHVDGPEGVSFYTRAKVVTARWPRTEHASPGDSGASFHFPTSK